MSKKTKATIETGPSGYENWKAALRGESVTSTEEVPFYSDAHVHGHWKEPTDRGPYDLLNALPIGVLGSHDPRGEVDLRPRLKKVYSLRSDALHNGIPFPAPMSEPVFGFEEIPMVSGMLGATWSETDRPMLLHVFEHITRGALISWWNKMADTTASST